MKYRIILTKEHGAAMNERLQIDAELNGVTDLRLFIRRLRGLLPTAEQKQDVEEEKADERTV